MPRLPRFELAGQAQHVIQRGNNREPVFAHDDDYAVYLNTLGDASQLRAKTRAEDR